MDRPLKPYQTNTNRMLQWRSMVWALCLLCQCVYSSATYAASEYEIKAAYLINFFNYVQWPEDVPKMDDQGVTHLCILGRDPFGKMIDHAAARNKAKQRIKIIRLSQNSGYPHCRLVFISAYENDHLLKLVPELSKQGVLVVTETRRLSEGGMINLINSSVKGELFIRFSIKQNLARKSRLTLSSELLKLAQLVNEEGGSP